MFLARSQHHRLLIVAGTLACRIAGHSALRLRRTHANESALVARVPPRFSKSDLSCFRHVQVPSSAARIRLARNQNQHLLVADARNASTTGSRVHASLLLER